MALFKTTEEIKQYLPVTVTFDFDALKPSINLAEQKYIIPFLGKEQYDELVTAYNADTLSDLQIELLGLVRAPLANFACLLFVPVGQLLITGSGIQQTANKDKRAAEQWRIEDLKKAFSDAGYDTIDPVLAFLEENKSDFAAWADSSVYTVLKQFFINTATEFSQFVSINDSRRTFMALRATMKKVEEFYIRPLTCKPLFDEIKAQIIAGGLSEENETLLELIQPAVAHLTIARALVELSITVDEKGLTVFNNTGSRSDSARQPATDSQVIQIATQSREDGQNYLTQIQDLLNLNLSDYPLYESSPCYRPSSSRQYPNDSTQGIYVF